MTAEICIGEERGRRVSDERLLVARVLEALQHLLLIFRVVHEESVVGASPAVMLTRTPVIETLRAFDLKYETNQT